jgi:hypothetical protein
MGNHLAERQALPMRSDEIKHPRYVRGLVHGRADHPLAAQQHARLEGRRATGDNVSDLDECAPSADHADPLRYQFATSGEFQGNIGASPAGQVHDALDAGLACRQSASVVIAVAPNSRARFNRAD